MLKVLCPSNLENEKTYIIDVVFSYFLGIDYVLEFDDVECFVLSNKSTDTKLLISSCWWDGANIPYLQSKFLPQSVEFSYLPYYPEKDAPILFGSPYINEGSGIIHCEVDIFATIFFMISRMEEVIDGNRDELGRFPGKSSIAKLHGFVERPIVDEYVVFLKTLMSKFFNVDFCNNDKFKKFVTCDVDFPYDLSLVSWSRILRSTLGIIYHERSFFKGVYEILNGFMYKSRLIEDRFTKALDFIMDSNDKVGNKVAFYFIPHITGKFDPDIEFSSSRVSKIITRIHERGHEVGIHMGFGCCSNYELAFKSVKIYQQALDSLGIPNNNIGCRMHYLKWDAYNTPSILEDCGISYDTSLAFPDLSGFRCGTTMQFPLFDFKKRKATSVIEIPLVNMEATIIGANYEGIKDPNLVSDRMEKFKSIVKKYGGTYTLLWHNNNLISKKWKRVYMRIIS